MRVVVASPCGLRLALRQMRQGLLDERRVRTNESRIDYMLR